jgi:hypothetical protein
VEDATHDGRLHLVRHEQLGVFVAPAAVGGASAHPFAFADAAFASGGDAVDDGGVLELGNTPSICSIIRPAAEPVSNGSVADFKTTSSWSSSSHSPASWRTFLERRSTR